MATAWKSDPSWIQRIANGVCTEIAPGDPGSGSQTMPLANKAFRCSSVSRPAHPFLKTCMGRDGICQEQEHLWQQFFLDPTLWWDNRRDKKSSRAPDFRRKKTGEVLWLNSVFKPAWVDEQLMSMDMQMGRCTSPSECGSPDRAGIGRGGTAEMDVVTALNVSTFCEQGKLSEAVGALESLVRTDSVISDSLFCTVLRLCTAKKDLVVGRRVHDLCVEFGYESNTYLGNHVLRMYACGGRLQEAMHVFTRVGNPDVITWGSIISAYAKHGKPNEAIQLYHEMRKSGVKPNGHVFVAALQACAFGADLESGRKVHSDVLHSGIPSNPFVGNCLVDMYAKCGGMGYARQVFDSMAVKDVVTWNALISGYAKCGELKDARQAFDSMAMKDVVTWNALIAGYVEQGLGHEALVLYEQMEQDGLILANHVTFACLLNACASTGALLKGKQLHSKIVERRLQGNILVDNCLVNMYAKCGELEVARQFFDSLATKDVVTWTSLIAGYAHQGLGQEALVLYGRMEQGGLILANRVTFACLLKACGSIGALQKGKQLHSQILKSGLLDDVVLRTCLVDMYAKCGELEDARQVFDSMATKDLATWNALISGYAKCGEMHNARQVFDSMATKDVVTWTALIAGYAQQGPGEEALIVYERMEQEGVILANHVTFACLLNACASTGALQKGRQLHSQIVERGLLDNVLLGNCLVDMYAKCGELEDARQVFESMNVKNVVTWNALISGYGTCDEGHLALACFEEMLLAGTQPNDATFTCLLVACSHGGLVEDGRKHFDSMAKQHGIRPSIEHYVCMTDLLGRAGHLDEAEKILSSCEGQSNVVGLRSLLNACKNHGDVERARRCFESIVRLDPQDAPGYVLMANVYADAGRWTDVDRIETQRRAAGANKKPAMATIEVNKQVHRFLVGERREDIALQAESTNARMKQEGGHVPHTKLVLKPVCEKEKEDALCGHAEKLALAFGLLNTPNGTPLVVTKNLRMCSDCHSSTVIMSRVEQRDIVVRDAYRVHRFAAGCCSCNGRP